MSNDKNTKINVGKIIKPLMAVILATCTAFQGMSQCGAPVANSLSGCSGQYALGAYTTSTLVTDHKWYAAPTGSKLAAIQPTNKGPAFPGSNQFVSTYTGVFNSNISVYVAATCGGVETARTKLSFTVTTPPLVAIRSSRSPGQLCDKDAITLTASGGSSYEWRINTTSGAPFSTAVSISPTQSGTYYLRGLDNCNVWKTASLSLNFKPSPTASVSPPGPIKLATTGVQSLVAQPQGSGYSYEWRRNGTIISGASANNYKVSGAGTYAVNVFQNGCGGLSNLVNVTINQKPKVTTVDSLEITLPANTIQLTGSATDPDGTITAYSWSRVSGPTPVKFGSPSASSTSVSELTGGVYVFRLTATDDTGESSTSDNVVVSVLYPANNYNYVLQITPQVEGQKSAADVAALPVQAKVEEINFFDGLGRAMQTVYMHSSPAGKDVVQPIQYDEFGRQSVEYLPFASTANDGFYKAGALGSPSTYEQSLQFDFYTSKQNGIAQDAMPFAKTVFEPSPLNRVSKKGAPGTAWQPQSSKDRTVKMVYGVNRSEDEVLCIRGSASGEITFTIDGRFVYYAPGTLHVEVVWDEHENDTKVYNDLSGKTVLKRVFVGLTDDGRQYAETYYVYDDFGNLVMVLPPEAVARIKAQQN